MKVPIKILLVEDQEADALAMLGMLKAADERFPNATTRVSNLEQAKTSMHLHDVVLLDLNLSDSEGPETVLHLRRSMPLGPPIYVYSSTNDQELIRQCGYAGAAGFFIKSADGALSVLPTMICGLGEISRRRQLNDAHYECDLKLEADLKALDVLASEATETLAASVAAKRPTEGA